MTLDDWDNYEKCYECTGYGDDYYTDENGELIWVCTDCIYNYNKSDD